MKSFNVINQMNRMKIDGLNLIKNVQFKLKSEIQLLQLLYFCNKNFINTFSILPFHLIVQSGIDNSTT